MEYKWVDWIFNKRLWAQVINRAVEVHGLSELAELIEVSETTLTFWGQMRYKDGFEWPHMSNFLKVTNLLDLDPRRFFELEE